MSRWLCSLWDSHKLSHDAFLELSAQFRTGHAQRKRDALEALRDERAIAVRKHVASEVEELTRTQPLQPFRFFPEAAAFTHAFRTAARRRPMLVITGGTNSGKSELGISILKEVGAALGVSGYLEVTVEGANTLDFGQFDVAAHAGVLLDGVADARILLENRELLQGRPKVCQGGKSATMMYAYDFTLCRRAVIITMDLSASNLHLFDVDH